MSRPNYSLPEYGLTSGQIEALSRMQVMPKWQRRRVLKAMVGGLRKPFLYKYLTFDTTDDFGIKKVRDLVVESKIYLAAPSDFNDPYDFQAQITVDTNQAVLYAYCVRSACDVLNAGHDPVPQVVGTQQKLRAMVSRAMDRLTNDPQSLIESFNRARDRNGIACFSEDPRELLMWAHYSGGHTGICLQFEVTEDLGVLGLSHRVSYRNELPKIVWPHVDSIVDEVILNKGRAWEAEKEVRHVSVKIVRNSLAYDGRALRAIILGARFPTGRVLDVLEMVRERASRGLPAPLFFRAIRREDSYGIRLKRIEP